MSTSKKKLKTIVFVDASNIIYGAKRESGFKVDFRKLAKYLKTRFNASKIYFYGGVNTKKIDFNKYEKMLERFGYVPRLKKTKFYYQKPKIKTFTCQFCKKRNRIKQKSRDRSKANCDVDLTIDVLENLDKFDRFIFLSGDGDFAPVMEKIKRLNKDIAVIASSKKTARVVKKIAAEKFIEIKNLKKIIAKKKRRHF